MTLVQSTGTSSVRGRPMSQASVFLPHSSGLRLLAALSWSAPLTDESKSLQT